MRTARPARKLDLDHGDYSAISHAGVAIVNPISSEKVDDVIGRLDLAPGARVVDVGCGKGELLIRVVERWKTTGVGVDPSRTFLDAARSEAGRRIGEGRLEFVESRAEEADLEPGAYDLAINVGASHAFGGYREALKALAGLVRPGGQVVYGDGFWRREPSPEYLVGLGAEPDELPDYPGLARAGIEAGLTPTYIAASSDDDWDRYEWGLRHSVERYAAAHADEPGIDGLLEWSRAARERYLGPGGRDTLGFALILFQRD